MKKIYSLAFAAFASVALSAQLTYTVTNGVYKLTYGKSGDWSFYNPQSNPTFYVHVWSAQSDGDNGNIFIHIIMRNRQKTTLEIYSFYIIFLILRHCINGQNTNR